MNTAEISILWTRSCGFCVDSFRCATDKRQIRLWKRGLGASLMDMGDDGYTGHEKKSEEKKDVLVDGEFV